MTQVPLIKRMEFSKTAQLSLRLVYCPSCHSKYNPIERCWVALENYWNGTVLDSVEAAIAWASHMTWKDVAPIAELLES
jgi:transposase